MNITLNKLNDLNSEIKIQLTPEDYKPRVEAELKKIHRTIALPGFRPGKSPFEIVRKRFGKSVLVDELNKLLQDSLHQYLAENNVRFIGHPLPKSNGQQQDWDNPSDFVFDYEIGHVPEFEINYPSEPLTYFKIKASDEMTEKYIEELTRRHGLHSYPESAGEGDILYGDFHELENGELKESGHHTTTTLAIEMIKDNEEKKKIIGLKKEDTFNFNPLKSLDETETKLMLNLKADDERLKSDYRFTVKTINHIEKAKLEPEFFDKIFGKDTVKTEEEFRQRTKEDYEKYLMRDSDRFLEHELRHAVLNANPISLPDDFLKRWLVSASEKPITMEQAEHEYFHQAEELRWKLLRDKIVETFQLNITDEEKNTVARQLVLSQFSRYGIYEVPEDKMQEMSKQYLNDKKIADNIEDSILNNKMIEHLRKNVSLKEQEINYDDFIKTVDEHQRIHHHQHDHSHEHAH
jgi:trigger factor